MKFLCYLIIPFFISCKSANLGDGECNENLKFKETFFHHIKYIEDNIGVLQDAKFRESVTFIYNYAPLSQERIMNYSKTYPTGIFEQDRVKWMQWYEENKCGNIQFKDKYIIPDVYQY